MDFARLQLEKYGWKDGEGLGKNQNGISQALKPKLKFDNAGLGHNLADEIINPWWQRVYDNAAENVKVKNDQEEISIVAGSTEITTKRKKAKKTKTKEKYNNFVMRAALTKEGEKRLGSDEEEIDEVPVDKKKKTSGICDLTDEELFKACGGRTAHKGARHGLSMSAKLLRSQLLEEQELAKLKGQTADVAKESSKVPKAAVVNSSQDSDAVLKTRKSKKKRKEKDAIIENNEQDTVAINADDIPPKKKKKLRKHEKETGDQDIIGNDSTEPLEKKSKRIQGREDALDDPQDEERLQKKKKKKQKELS